MESAIVGCLLVSKTTRLDARGGMAASCKMSYRLGSTNENDIIGEDPSVWSFESAASRSRFDRENVKDGRGGRTIVGERDAGGENAGEGNENEGEEK